MLMICPVFPMKVNQTFKLYYQVGKKSLSLNKYLWILYTPFSHCFMWVFINSCLTHCNIFLCIMTTSISSFIQVSHFIFMLPLDKSSKNEIWCTTLWLKFSNGSSFPYLNLPHQPHVLALLHYWTLTIWQFRGLDFLSHCSVVFHIMLSAIFHLTSERVLLILQV